MKIIESMTEQGFVDAPRDSRALGRGLFGTAFNLDDGNVLKIGRLDGTSLYHAKIWADCQARGPYHLPFHAPRVEACGIIDRRSRFRYAEVPQPFLFWSVMEHVVIGDDIHESRWDVWDKDIVREFENYWQASVTDLHDGNWGVTLTGRLVLLDIDTNLGAPDDEIASMPTVQQLMNRSFRWS